MFKEFGNELSFWSYEGEGGPFCFFLLLGGMFFVMCLKRCVCNLVVIIFMDNNQTTNTTAYSVYLQLPSILEAVPPFAT